eukprot:3025259-Alexandrium_andersonii.AAC.1
MPRELCLTPKFKCQLCSFTGAAQEHGRECDGAPGRARELRIGSSASNPGFTHGARWELWRT